MKAKISETMEGLKKGGFLIDGNAFPMFDAAPNDARDVNPSCHALMPFLLCLLCPRAFHPEFSVGVSRGPDGPTIRTLPQM